MLYANLITEKIDRASALETLRYVKELAAAAAEEDGLDAGQTRVAFEKRARRLAGTFSPGTS